MLSSFIYLKDLEDHLKDYFSQYHPRIIFHPQGLESSPEFLKNLQWAIFCWSRLGYSTIASHRKTYLFAAGRQNPFINCSGNHPIRFGHQPLVFYLCNPNLWR